MNLKGLNNKLNWIILLIKLKIHSSSDSKSNEFAIKQNLLNKLNKVKKEYFDEIKKVSLKIFKFIVNLHQVIII